MDEKEELLQKIKEQIQNETRGMAKSTDLEERMKPFADLDLDGLRALTAKENGILEIVRKQGELISELEKKTTSSTREDNSLGAQIRAWGESNKDAIEKIKQGEKADLKPLQLRVAITMTEAASLNSSAYLPNVEVAPGIIDLVRVQPTFWNRLAKGRTRANPYVWVNKTNKQGNAEFIGEGVLKPLASFELETETSVPKKVAERFKVSTELLYDFEGLESYIRDEMRYEVETAANTAVLTGTESSTVPAGITTLASAFTLTTINTPNPNYSDAIRAAIAQIRSLNFNGPLMAFINPIDAANMDLQKATDSGVYMLPPFTTADGRIIAGTPVIEDNNIAVGYLLIGDMTKYKILMHQDFFVAMGWENDDFSKNLVTLIGEMRFHQWFSDNWVGAFIYDTFANIQSAITPDQV